MISLDALTATLLVGTVIPLVVAALTKSRASSATKALANLVLSAAGGAFSALATAHGHLAWQSFVIAGAATYAASGSAHSHLWSPTGITEAVAGVAPNAGVGTAVAPAGKHAAK